MLHPPLPLRRTLVCTLLRQGKRQGERWPAAAGLAGDQRGFRASRLHPICIHAPFRRRGLRYVVGVVIAGTHRPPVAAYGCPLAPIHRRESAKRFAIGGGPQLAGAVVTARPCWRCCARRAASKYEALCRASRGLMGGEQRLTSSFARGECPSTVKTADCCSVCAAFPQRGGTAAAHYDSCNQSRKMSSCTSHAVSHSWLYYMCAREGGHLDEQVGCCIPRPAGGRHQAASMTLSPSPSASVAAWACRDGTLGS